jgi:hypothetical protein
MVWEVRVPTIVAPVVGTSIEAGSVRNTCLVPAARVTTEPLLEEAITVVRARVVPDVVNVPNPTSQALLVRSEIA